MATPPPLPEKVTKEPNSETPPQMTPFAWTGTCQGRAAPTHTFPDTGALAAGTVTTEPKPADSRSPKFSALTTELPSLRFNTTWVHLILYSDGSTRLYDRLQIQHMQ
jgi:hypothetical protein